MSNQGSSISVSEGKGRAEPCSFWRLSRQDVKYSWHAPAFVACPDAAYKSQWAGKEVEQFNTETLATKFHKKSCSFFSFKSGEQSWGSKIFFHSKPLSYNKTSFFTQAYQVLELGNELSAQKIS